MCRNIRTLHNFDPPATAEEVHASALQYVRKISGSTKPSQANSAAFEEAAVAGPGAAPQGPPGRWGAGQAAGGPEGEEDGEDDPEAEGETDHGRVAGDEAAARLEQRGHRVDAGDRVDPAAEQGEGDVHRGHE